jgi:hypothetical protein
LTRSFPVAEIDVCGRGGGRYIAGVCRVHDNRECRQVRELHPSEHQLLGFFSVQHLTPTLREVSLRYGDLAWDTVALCEPGPETTTALRKLLEAKDCAVRARLDTAEA